MTSRERAYAAARKWMPDSEPDSMKLIALMCHIELAIDEAVEAEREACLREATGRSHSCPHVEHVADAIRARGDR